MTLGTELRRQEQARRSTAERNTDFASRRAMLKVDAQRAAARFFFEEVKLDIEEAAEARKPLRSIRVPDQFRQWHDGGYKLFEGCDEQLIEFGRWCIANGLRYDFGNEHDGVGREDWATIIVTPAD